MARISLMQFVTAQVVEHLERHHGLGPEYEQGQVDAILNNTKSSCPTCTMFVNFGVLLLASGLDTLDVPTQPSAADEAEWNEWMKLQQEEKQDAAEKAAE